MQNSIFPLFYYLGVLGTYLIRIPSLLLVSKTMKKGDRKSTRQKFENEGLFLGVLMMLWWLLSTIVPLFFIFTHWIDFSNYSLPVWAGFFGIFLFIIAIILLYRAHSDLGRNWSSTVQIQQEQGLVTQGIYQYIRHPIYAAHFLWGIAAILLLHNWIAGWGGLLLFTLVYFLRVPNEETLMIEKFGDEYRQYMQRTGRVIPKLIK